MPKKNKYQTANAESSAIRSKPGRQRCFATHEAILRAALYLLQKHGYRAITIEGIAGEARVGKQTIYRWWPSKAAVVLEAFGTFTQGRVNVPDSGNLCSDLTCFLQATFNQLATECGPIVRGLMSEALLDPEFAVAFRELFIAKRRQIVLEILQHGVERGEIVAPCDFELIVDMLYGPMWYRLLNQHAPLDLNFAEQLSLFVTKVLTCD
jgi:AcrR family transcriptional regulator